MSCNRFKSGQTGSPGGRWEPGLIRLQDLTAGEAFVRGWLQVCFCFVFTFLLNKNKHCIVRAGAQGRGGVWKFSFRGKLPTLQIFQKADSELEFLVMHDLDGT